MRYELTNQGRYRFYLWENKNNPLGIESSSIVLTKKQVTDLKDLLMDFDDEYEDTN